MDNIHPPAGYVSVSPLEQWHKLLLEPTHIELQSTRHHWCTIITKTYMSFPESCYGSTLKISGALNSNKQPCGQKLLL